MPKIIEQPRQNKAYMFNAIHCCDLIFIHIVIAPVFINRFLISKLIWPIKWFISPTINCMTNKSVKWKEARAPYTLLRRATVDNSLIRYIQRGFCTVLHSLQFFYCFYRRSLSSRTETHQLSSLQNDIKSISSRVIKELLLKRACVLHFACYNTHLNHLDQLKNRFDPKFRSNDSVQWQIF